MERILRTILYVIVGLIALILLPITILIAIIFFTLFGKKQIKFGRPRQGRATGSTATHNSQPGGPRPTVHQEYDIDAVCTVIEEEEPVLNNAQIGSDNESN